MILKNDQNKFQLFSSCVVIILHVLCDNCVKQSNPQFWSLATTVDHPIWLLSIMFQRAVEWYSTYSWSASHVHMQDIDKKQSPNMQDKRKKK